MKPAVLVTGATGFIGRRLVDRLLGDRYRVRAVLRDSRGPRARDGLSVVRWDLLDPRRPGRGLRGVRTVVHLAAHLPGPARGARREAEDFNENVVMTANLIGALKDLRHVVFTSTIDVYGRPRLLPIGEDHPTEPLTDYGRSKLRCEHFLQEAAAARGLTLSVLRLAQVYGPGERPIKAIPRFVEAVRAGRQPVIYGDGSDVRDYLYVDDAARAIVLALERDAGGVFNISGGQAHAIADVVTMLARVTPGGVRPVYADRVGEKLDFWMDIGRASDVLGYSPQVRLQEGLRRHYEWAVRETS